MFGLLGMCGLFGMRGLLLGMWGFFRFLFYGRFLFDFNYGLLGMGGSLFLGMGSLGMGFFGMGLLGMGLFLGMVINY